MSCCTSYNAAFKGLDRQLDDAIDHWRYLPNEGIIEKEWPWKMS
ncbi:MAG: hypothetical protein R2788_24210 [Saprospiraceae bacterium]